MHPIKSGQGLFPRYGGGWMHQFGHVYALQQELLNPGANDWFRAMELYHAARREGLALNSAHYTNLLRQCVRPSAATHSSGGEESASSSSSSATSAASPGGSPWEAALSVLAAMKRDGVRPDVVGVGCVLASCAEAGRRAAVEEVFAAHARTMLLDSVCHLALIRARAEAGDAAGAAAAGRAQAAAGVPRLPYTYALLLEAAETLDDTAYAAELARDMRADGWAPDARGAKALRALALRHPEAPELAELLLPEDRAGLLERTTEKKRGEGEEEEDLHLPLPPRQRGGEKGAF